MLHALAVLAARILLSLMFTSAGIETLGNIDGAAGYFSSLGLPLPVLVAWGSSLFDLIAGLMVLIGALTRPAAILLAAYALAAGFIGHFGQGGDDALITMMHQQALLKDIAVAGGMLLLALQGPGRLSIDAALGRRA